MKKIRIDLNDLSASIDPLEKIYKLFGIDLANAGIEDLYEKLIHIEDVLIVELVQNGLINDNIYKILICFENVQQKSNKFYLVHEVD